MHRLKGETALPVPAMIRLHRLCFAFALALMLPAPSAEAAGGRACDTFADVTLEALGTGLDGTWTLIHTGEWSDGTFSASDGLDGRKLIFGYNLADTETEMRLDSGPDLMLSHPPLPDHDTTRETRLLDAWLDSLVDESQPETPAVLRNCPVSDEFVIYGDAPSEGQHLPEGSREMALRLFPVGEDRLDGFLEISGYRAGRFFTAWRTLTATRR